MRQKLEQLIEDLNREIGICEIVLDEDEYEYETAGYRRGLVFAKARLREVLKSDAPENGIEVPVQKDDD